MSNVPPSPYGQPRQPYQQGGYPPGMQPPPQQPPGPQPPKKRKRRWPYVLLVLFVLLIGLVLLIPTIASTGFVRGIVEGQVNEQINGKVEIADWSIGWTGGVKVKGVNVYDAQNNLLLVVNDLTTQLSLLDAARGNLALGDTVIDVDLKDVRVNQDGSTNLQALLPESGPAAPQTTDAVQPGQLPNLSGNITINLQGNIGGDGIPAPVRIEPSTINVQIADFDQPINNDVKLVYRVGQGRTGRILVKGSADIAENRRLDVENAVVSQAVTLADVELAALNAVLKSMGQELQAGGIANGGIDVSAKGLNDLSANGVINIANLSARGGPLKGDDVFAAGEVVIPIKASRTVSDGKTHLRVEQLHVAMEGGQLLNLAVTADAPEAALLAAANLIPQVVGQTLSGKGGSLSASLEGGNGTAQVSLTADVDRLAGMLRSTIALEQGTQITQGTLTHRTDVTIADNRATVATSTELPDLQGTADGKPVRLSPVKVSAGVGAVGGAHPDLRDLALDFSSGFLTAKGGGATLSNLKIDGGFDLAKLQREASQFINLNELVNPGRADRNVALAGTGTFGLTTQGDLIQEGGTTRTLASLNLSNVRVTGVGDLPEIRQDSLAATIEGDLQRGKGLEPFITGWNNVVVAVLSGPQQQPILDLLAKADLKLPAGESDALAVPRFELTRLSVPDLRRVQEQYAAFVPALQESGLRLAGGSLDASAAGSFVNETLVLDRPFELRLAKLSLDRRGRSVLAGETIGVVAQGTVAVPGGALSAKLSQLAVTSSSGLFSLTKAKDQDFTVAISPQGQISGGGSVQLTAAMKKLHDVGIAFGGEPNNTPQPDKAGEIRSGEFAATLRLVSDARGTTVNLDGDIKNLSVETNEKPIENETISFTASAVSPADLSALTADVRVGSSLLVASVTDARLALNAGLWDMLQSAAVEASLKDLPRLQAIAGTFGQPATPAPLAEGAEAVEPIVVSSGAATVRLDVKRDAANQTTVVNIPELRVTKLDLRRGKQSYRFNREKDITFTLAAAIQAAEQQGKTVMEQIRQVQVTQLAGDLRVATLSMPQPITITNLASPTPTANGSVKIDGTLDDAGGLVAFLQGQELPYRGSFAVVQNLKTSGNVITLDGSGDVTNFQVLGEDGKPAITEERIRFTNALDADTNSKNLAVRGVKLEMPRSEAVGINLVGTVRDWETARAFENTTLDLSYDLAKLWPIVRPMLSPEQQEELKDLKVVGKHTKRFTVTGSFPAKDKGRDLEFQQSIRYVTAEGSFTIDQLDTSGANIQEMENPILLRGGKLQRLKAPPAKLNGGTLDLSGIVVDLGKDNEPRLTIVKGTQLLKNVSINDLLSGKLGKFINPVFADMKQSKGLLDVTVEYCDSVALGEKMKTPESGKARVVFSLTDMQVASNILGVLMAGPQRSLTAEQARAYTAEIRNGVIELANGRTTQDVTFDLKNLADVGNDRISADPRDVRADPNPPRPTDDDRAPRDERTTRDDRAPRDPAKTLPLTFKGEISLASLKQNLQVSVPPELIAPTLKMLTGISEKDFINLFPRGVPVTMRGTTTNAQLDWQDIVVKAGAAKVLQGTGGKGDGKDPLGGLLQGVLGGDKEKEEQRNREQRERDQRDREQRERDQRDRDRRDPNRNR